MQIKSLFTRRVDRPINGVIKADQSDDASVWQELEEYVITRELDQHFRGFFDNYLKAMDNPKESAGRVGVWISGFFGSGKSHFLKILSYLLENKEVVLKSESRRASDFFESKITDTLLAADIERATAKPTDVLLFNIDSKADAEDGRGALLTVFLNVFNEKLGYSPHHPAVAHMERYLDEQGHYESFKSAFAKAAGKEWVSERDAYAFHLDEIGAALSEVLDRQITDPSAWIDRFVEDFSLTVENLANWIKQYLDSKSNDQRIVFLVDEIGQFIGQDTHLMLSLQTIAENLGTVCEGRAWLVVTSQEDIDSIIGEVRSAKANDFSKIQGRFSTRLSLSSGNVDEVIEKRLLDKPSNVKDELRQLYRSKADILKNQLSFTNTGRTFKTYTDEDNFANVYPFAPYQFQLVQRIFESIRKAGATGLHLARGERSLLDAFQQATSALLSAEVGVLVPLHRFYPSIESFLEGVVKSTIDNARDNPSLEAFDQDLLKTLFLIRYVEEIKGNVDNLITLFIDQIDADRRSLRQSIEASLQRLEKQSLISRNGDDFFFLTNEERDVTKEIKLVDVSGADEAKELGTLIYAEVLKDLRKYRFPQNGKDFAFSRLCDLHPYGGRGDGDLVVSVISPLADDREDYSEAACILRSGSDNGHVLLRMPDDNELGRELRTWLQTERYIRLKNDGTLPHSTQQILRDRRDENNQRRKRLIAITERLFTESESYIAGNKQTFKAGSAGKLLEDALEYLVTNTFNKLGYLKYLMEDPHREARSLLNSPMTSELDLEVTEEANPRALQEVASFVETMSSMDRRVILSELIENRFAARPYGWPESETLLLVIRLLVNGEVSLLQGDNPLARDRVWENIQTPSRWRNLRVIKRQTVDNQALAKARKLAKDVFQSIAPDGEDALHGFLSGSMGTWKESLGQWQTLANTGTYPGRDKIETLQRQLNRQLAIPESYPFIQAFLKGREDWMAACESWQDLHNFYTGQRIAWESLRNAQQAFSLNRKKLDQDDNAHAALDRIETILNTPEPYGLIHEAEGLITTVRGINESLLAKLRAETDAYTEKQIGKVMAILDEAQADAQLRNRALLPLQNLVKTSTTEKSIAHLMEMRDEARDLADQGIDLIQRTLAEEKAKAMKEAASSTTPSVTYSPTSTAAPHESRDKPKAPTTQPSIRPRKVVEPHKFTNKPYLETQADVDDFLAKLRDELEAVISRQGRIEIR